MTQYQPQGFKMLPPGVKNILIINVLFFLAQMVVPNALGFDLQGALALYSPLGSSFRPWQYATYMFLHGSFDHILFNMFALWMFGYVLENIWGTRRFVIYYLACGLGAGMIHTLVTGIGGHIAQEAINNYALAPSADAFQQILQQQFRGLYNTQLVSQFIDQWRSAGADATQMGQESIAICQQLLDHRMNIPTVGASGAVYGILLAFGMMFPNEQIYLYFLIPIKAKWFVIGYGILELFLGIAHTADGIAHFAHLGGMLIGLILILIWRKQAMNNHWS